MKNRFHWGLGVATIYIVFVTATTSFVVFAMRRPVDLVSTDYYAQSLRQDQRAEATANVSALGPQFSVAVTHGELRLALPASQIGARGTITLYRPSSAADDRDFPIALDVEGHQRVDLTHIPAGQWMVKIEWTAAHRLYYHEQPASLE